MMAAAQAGGATLGEPSPAAMLGILIPFYLGYLLLALVLYAAAIRAALRPEEDSFASMRLGMDELRLFAVILLLIVISIVTLIVGSIVAGMVAGILAVIAQSTGSGAAFFGVFAAIAAVYGLAIFVQVRLSPAIPLTIMRRQIVITEAWTLSRGRFWTLFGGYVVLTLIMLIVLLIVVAFTMGPYMAELAQHGFTPQGIEAANQVQMQRQLGGIGVMTVIGWILGGLIGGVSFAVWGGALAAVADGLVGATDVDYAATFE
ncbi:MAG: hypothetical protein ABIO86_13055 [Sphingomonas sp.]